MRAAYFFILYLEILFRSIFILCVQDAFRKYLAKHRGRHIKIIGGQLAGGHGERGSASL